MKYAHYMAFYVYDDLIPNVRKQRKGLFAVILTSCSYPVGDFSPQSLN